MNAQALTGHSPISRRPSAWRLFALALVSAAVGCSEAPTPAVPVYPASGKITFKGQPMPGAFIALHPKTPVDGVPNPRASVDKEGNFTVSTFAGNDGAPEGQYVLTVQWFKQIKNGADVVSGPNVVPKKFSTAQSSDLEVKIIAGANELPTIRL